MVDRIPRVAWLNRNFNCHVSYAFCFAMLSQRDTNVNTWSKLLRQPEDISADIQLYFEKYFRILSFRMGSQRLGEWDLRTFELGFQSGKDCR